MNPLDLFNQVKELVENKDFSAAKTFVEENKDQLGEYLSQAQALVSGSEGLDGLVDKVKGLFIIIKRHLIKSGVFLYVLHECWDMLTNHGRQDYIVVLS